jgi:Skp family chaperone for outer membrane proteins
MFDRKLLLSYLDGLITESQKKRETKAADLRKKGTEEGDKAAEELTGGKHHGRFMKHLDWRKKNPKFREELERKQSKNNKD